MKSKHLINFCLFILPVMVSTVSKAQQTVSTDTLHKPTPFASDSAKKLSSGDLIFEKTEVEASVDAGLWRQHLASNLGAYLEKAAKKGMKAGQYTINVRFLVEKNGSMSDVVALNDPGFGLSKAAVTVIKTGPRWKAGELNGTKVRSYHTQPITFQIIDE